MTQKTLTFRQLDDADLEAFREIRLEAVKDHPEAFLGNYEEESKKSDMFFLNKIHSDKVFGCFKGEKLMAIVGYYVITPEGKRAHSAKIWGFYIRDEYRGRGFAKKLFKVLLDDMEQYVEKALLKVYAKNRGAVKLYRSLGFEVYGFEKKSLKIGDKYYDDYLMSKFLNE